MLDGLYGICWYEPKNFRNKCVWTPQEQSYGTGNLHTFDFIDSWNKIEHKSCVSFYIYWVKTNIWYKSKGHVIYLTRLKHVPQKINWRNCDRQATERTQLKLLLLGDFYACLL